MTPLFVYHERGEDDTQIELYIIYGTRFSGVYHKWGGKSPEGNSPKEILWREILRGKFLEGNYPRPFPVGKFVTQLVLKTVSVKPSGSWISVFAASSSITSIFNFKILRRSFA